MEKFLKFFFPNYFSLVLFIYIQIFEEVEIAKRRNGKLNRIVMNAVMEACVHCGDIDSALAVFDEMSKPQSCGVDTVTYGTLLKVLFFPLPLLFFLLPSMNMCSKLKLYIFNYCTYN